MGVWIFKSLFISLMMTLALELPFCIAMKVRRKKDLLLAVLVNVLTNPFVVLTYHLTSFYTNWNRVMVVGILEVGAVVVEGVCYQKFGDKIKHPYALAIGANLFSYFTGLLINYIL